jgi:hypothetical protein
VTAVDASGLSNLCAGNVTSGQLAVTFGGTGTSSSTGVGSVVLSGSPSISGSASFSNINFTGALTQNGVSFASLLSAQTQNIVYSSNMIVQGDTTLYGVLTQSNAAFFSSDITVTGNADVNTMTVANAAGTSSTVALVVNGIIQVSGDVVASSDATLKTDLVAIPNALDKVNSLTGYTFRRFDNFHRSMGLLAQDVQAVAPELVQRSTDGTLVLAYGNVSALLVEAIKDLSAQVASLQAQVRALV